MAHHCLGCGKSYDHKTGLSNHRRVCERWKNLDRVAKHKKQRVETLTWNSGPSGLDLGSNLQIPPDLLGDNDRGSGTLGNDDDTGMTCTPSSSAAVPQTSTRSGRRVRFPRRLNDYLPVMRTALAHIPSKEIHRNPPPSIVNSMSPPDALAPPASNLGSGAENSGCHVAESAPPPDALEPVTTVADCFGMYRVYARSPLVDPSQRTHTLDPQAIDSSSGQPPHPDKESMPYFYPFSNPSAAAMMVAHHLGTPVQSIHQTTQTARILGSLGLDLDPSDLCDFNAALETKKMDACLASVSESTFHCEDGWHSSSVRIRLPLDRKKMPEDEAVEFEIGGVIHRDIVDVISSVYQSDAVQSFNHIPFKQFWKPSEDAPPERLYGEIYSSQAMLDADNDICKNCLGNDLDSPDLEAICCYARTLRIDIE